MANLLKQSSTAQPLLFQLILTSDHISGATGITPTVTLSKSGAAFASPAGAVTEIANGWYKVAGNATDTGTLGPLILHATGAACDPVDVVFEVVAFDPQSATDLGLSTLTAAATASALSSVGTSATTAATQSTAAATSAASADGKLTGGRLGKLDSLTFTASGKVDSNTLMWNGNLVSWDGAPDVNVSGFGGSNVPGDVYATFDLPLTAGLIVSTTGTATTLANTASTIVDFYKHEILQIVAGAGAGQSRVIAAYSTGRVATHAAWLTNPDNTSRYAVLPGRSDVTHVNGTATTIDTDVTAVKTKTDQFVFTTGNRVDATMVDKAGVKLASDGLDQIAKVAPSGSPSAWTFPQWLMWVVRRWVRSSYDSNAQTLVVKNESGSTISTQTATSSGGVESTGELS